MPFEWNAQTFKISSVLLIVLPTFLTLSLQKEGKIWITRNIGMLSFLLKVTKAICHNIARFLPPSKIIFPLLQGSESSKWGLLFPCCALHLASLAFLPPFPFRLCSCMILLWLSFPSSMPIVAPKKSWASSRNEVWRQQRSRQVPANTKRDRVIRLDLPCNRGAF